MNNFMTVFIGGGFGAIARYGLSLWLARAGSAWPSATFVANGVGGLLMGILMGVLLLKGGDQERWRLLLGVGVLGGFTTFSSFSYEVVGMFERKQWGLGLAYALASVIVSVVAVMVGLFVVKKVSL